MNTQPAESEILDKAINFINTLHPPQKDLTPNSEHALFYFDHKNRETFDYFAPSSQFTRGLPLRYMNANQLNAIDELLKVSLSGEGYKALKQLRLLENVLAFREKDIRNGYIRDPLAYYIAFFGMPSDQGFWSWRIQGHHLFLQWTFLNGKIISTTPQFIGAQPAEVKEGDIITEDLPLGTRILGQEEDLARDFIESLSDEQKQAARGQIQWDIDTTNVSDSLNERYPNRLEDDGNGIRGILYSALTENQQKKLRALIVEYTATQLSIIAQERIERIEQAGWNNIIFFFINGLERGDALYYKIRGKTFLIEYLNKAFSQPNMAADHQHSVWRDFYNDWGRDKFT